jgi:hypothetical protein
MLAYLFSQKKTKEKLNVATPAGNFLWSFQSELSPIIIATQFSRKRHVYISPDSIVKVLCIHLFYLLEPITELLEKTIIDPITIFLPKDNYVVIQPVSSLSFFTCGSEQ